MHPRKAIRRKVIAVLKAANTAAGQEVHPNRVIPLTLKRMPAFLIYTLQETIDPESVETGPRELTRLLDLQVDAIVAAVTADEALDDTLDDLALEIEQALHADTSLGGLSDDLYLVDTDVGFDPDGEIPAGRVSLTYRVKYRTLAIAPDDDLDDDLLRVGASHQHTGATSESLPPLEDETLPATPGDLITVQELES